jgi:hypothetical protein
VYISRSILFPSRGPRARTTHFSPAAAHGPLWHSNFNQKSWPHSPRYLIWPNVLFARRNLIHSWCGDPHRLSNRLLLLATV